MGRADFLHFRPDPVGGECGRTTEKRGRKKKKIDETKISNNKNKLPGNHSFRCSLSWKRRRDLFRILSFIDNVLRIPGDMLGHFFLWLSWVILGGFQRDFESISRYYSWNLGHAFLHSLFKCNIIVFWGLIWLLLRFTLALKLSLLFLSSTFLLFDHNVTTAGRIWLKISGNCLLELFEPSRATEGHRKSTM